MAITVKHAFVSPKIDGPDPTIVRPSNWNEDHVLSGTGWFTAGMVIDYLGHSIPAGFLEAYGQSVSVSAYPLLYNALVKGGTVTFTAGTPGVVNWANHGLTYNTKIRFFNSGGALPAAITAGVDYWIAQAGLTPNSFRITNGLGGAEVAFATGGTGTHTAVNAQFGVSSDFTTFTVPDLRGYVLAGLDSMGGTASGRLSSSQSGSVSGQVLGAVGGSQGHVLIAGEVGGHTHPLDPPNPTVDFSGFVVTSNSTGSNHTHSIDPPVTATTMGGAGSAHTHTVDPPATFTGSETANHSHAQTGRVYGASYGGAGSHTHSFEAGQFIEKYNSGGGAGSHTILQPSAETGAFGNFPMDAAGAHEHTVYVDLAGNTGIESAVHSHAVNIPQFNTGSAGGGADHSHNVDIAPFTTAAGGSHTHGTTLSGTITSAQADYTSGLNAGGAAHNNVQPTLIARKLIYAG